MTKLFTLPKEVVLTNSGALIPGAKAFFYEAGTATPLSVYTTHELTTPHSNPVVADSSGRFPAIYYGADDYKVKLTDASDVEIYSQDYAATLLDAAEVGAALYPVTAAETTAGVTPTNYQYPPGDVLRYGTNTTPGTTDMTTAIQAAFDSVGTGQHVVFPQGTYLVSSNITMSSKNNVSILGYGAILKEASGVLTGMLSFTSCDFLRIEGLDFVAGEDDTYFQANDPTGSGREFISLLTCDDVFIRAISGKNKRNHITADQCTRLNISDFTFYGFAGTLALPNTSSNANYLWCINLKDCDYASVSNGQVFEQGSGVLSQTSSTHLTISNISGKDLHDNGVYISSGTNIAISNCSFLDVVGDGVQARGDFIAISNCVMENCDDVGISVTPLSTAGVTGSCSITGNVVNDCDLGIRAIQNTNEPADVVISDNVVKDCKLSSDDGAIAIGSQTGRVTITGNVVQTTATDCGIAIGDVGTVTSHVVVSNNVVSDVNGSAANTRGGIRMDDCTSFVVNGNVFSDIASTIGVRCRTASNGIVSNNMYEGGQVVRIPAAESNTGIFVIGNKGSTISVDGPTNNLVGSNDATITGSNTYTPTNVSTDRAYDADTVAVAELADIVGTLIADLQAQGIIQ